ncbi:restriction endonuclease subunit S [Corallococcus sp. H22C18031201]|nr:restriction endonuclease subunit S [Corallococcus sp. H22C18031201]
MTRSALSPLVPKLRFAEFADAPEWGCAPLKKLAKRITQRNTHGAELKALTNSAEYGIVEQREFFDKDIATNTDSYYVVELGDYVYNPRVSSSAPVGPISKNHVGTGVMSPLYMVFRFRSEANEFFAHYFRSSHWHGYLRRVSNSGARHDRMAITNDDLMRIPIPTPSPREQQKIADCLGSLDELIAAEGRKLEALRQHKERLMAQLFPQGDESVPRLRFPEFQDAGHWERAPFSKLCDIKHGYAFEGEFFNDEGNYVLLTPGNFYERGGYRDRGEKQKYYTGEIPRDYVLNRGDLLVAMTEQAVGLLGSSILVPDSDKFLHNQRLGLVTKKIGIAWSNEFFFYVFNTQPVREAIQGSASGMKVRHTSPAKIGQVVVSFSPSLSEQQRIAECLSGLDAGIAGQTNKLEALKQHKQGLLQQLFPSMEGEAQ